MHEDFLHHIWQYGKFAFTNLLTANGDFLQIIHPGHFLQKAGPDFFDARIRIGDQLWAGNVEIHLMASDWYLHHHENDPAYENVILHVVWENDVPVFRSNNSVIPVLELKDYVKNETLSRYLLLSERKSWIYCEKNLRDINPFILRNW